MSDQPVIADRTPMPVDVTEGETYWWCTCGRSASQPFCDGSHNAEDCSFSPMEWTAPATRTMFFCTCKHTKKGPLCDGSHGAL